MQAAGALGGGVFGIGMGMLNDNRQAQQNARLLAQQERYNKRMTNFNAQKQLEMWEATGYGATKEQMKRAGLNPALLYGMGGSGGGTTNVATSSGSGATASGHTGEMAATVGMGLQLAMQKAQIENIQADTKQKEVQAGKTAGVDTDEAKARIEEILQGVDNARVQNDKMVIERSMLEMARFEQGQSQQDRLDQIKWNAKQAAEATKRALNENYITARTIPERIQIVQQQAIEAVLRNSQINKNMALTDQQIKESANKIMQEWDRIENADDAIQQLRKQIDYSTDPVQQMNGDVLEALKDILE